LWGWLVIVSVAIRGGGNGQGVSLEPGNREWKVSSEGWGVYGVPGEL